MNVQQSHNKRDFIIPEGHYGLLMSGGYDGHIMPGGHYWGTL